MVTTEANEEQRDVFHPVFRELTANQKDAIAAIKETAAKLYAMYDRALSEDAANAPREIALSKTKLEESVMWAVKGITK
jgi:hypothetical protein